ncbi:MAG: hypothetical protein Q7S08_04105, partial [bacterium]|nr:hypothetical protein [bacterium]
RRFRVYFVHTREFSPDLAVKPEKWACFRIAANQILLLYPHMYNYGISPFHPTEAMGKDCQGNVTVEILRGEKYVSIR